MANLKVSQEVDLGYAGISDTVFYRVIKAGGTYKQSYADLFAYINAHVTLQMVLDNDHSLVNGIALIGTNAGASQTGTQVTFIGTGAGQNNSGLYVIGIGYEALYGNDQNQAIGFGYHALYNNRGAAPYAMGYEAGMGNGGNQCIMIGNYALKSNSGNNSIGIGYNAGIGNSANSIIAIAVSYTHLRAHET